MDRTLRACLLLLFCIALFTSASADEIYVGNRPYKGQVTGLGTDLSFQLQELSEALRLASSMDGEKWSLAGYPVKTTAKDRGVWVKLDALPPEVVRVVINRDLGTVDLYRLPENLKSEPVIQDWEHPGVVVYFYAEWSQSCQSMKPSLAALERSRLIRLEALNIDQPYSRVFKRQVKHFRGDKIPYFVVLNAKGRRMGAFDGFQTYPQLTDKLKKILGE